MISLLFSDTEVTFLYSIIDVISIVISIGLFILKGFAIRYIAKKNGYNNLWMAFVPFLNYILLGKYIGKCKVWGLNLKNIGLWLCIMSAVQLFGSGIINAGYYVDSFIQTLEGFGLSAKITFSSKFFEMFYYLTGGSYGQTSYLAEITNISIYTNVIFLLVDLAILIAYAFFEINFFLLLFKKLAPQYLTMFTILFIYRDKEPFDYDAYMQMRRARYYSSYYNNPYGNQYGNPYNNPYANPNATQGSAQNVDPFPEFGNGDATNSGSDNPFGTEGFGQDN